MEEKKYRGFKSETEYFYKDNIFTIKDVSAEKLNEWDDIWNKLRKDEFQNDEGYYAEKELAEDILSNSLDGYDKISKSLHPKVKSGMAGELFIFLSNRLPKEEQDYLRTLLRQDPQAPKSQKQSR